MFSVKEFCLWKGVVDFLEGKEYRFVGYKVGFIGSYKVVFGLLNIVVIVLVVFYRRYVNFRYVFYLKNEGEFKKRVFYCCFF